MGSLLHDFAHCAELSLDEFNLEKGVLQAREEASTDEYSFEGAHNQLLAARLNDLIMKHIEMAKHGVLDTMADPSLQR